jgi:hypothetical protein
MGMQAESAATGHLVVIQHAQRAKMNFLGSYQLPKLKE